MAVVWAPNLWTGDLEPTLEFGRGFPCVGRISVHVKEGRRIVGSQAVATTCAEVSLGNLTSFRTKCLSGSEPVWDEKFDFVLDENAETLEIRVFEQEPAIPPKDKRKASPPVSLGHCSLPLHMLLPFAKPGRSKNPPKPGKHMAWFELTKTSTKSESAGHVQLTVLYYPPSMCDPPTAVDPSAKEKLRPKKQQEKKTAGSKIFGGTLAESLKWTNTEGLPQVCVTTVEHIRNTGLDVQGIFRIVGSSDVIAKLKDDFENLKEVDMQDIDPHDAAGLLKMYVRELSEPLIPFSHYAPFLDVAAGRFHIFEEVEQYKILIASIPADRRRVLRFMFEFLFDVTQHSKNNRMVPSSLAVVFAPNLLRSENDSPQSALLNSPNAIRVVGTLIESFRRIFETSAVVVHLGDEAANGEGSNGALNGDVPGILPSSPHKNWTLPRRLSTKISVDTDQIPTLFRARSDYKTPLSRTGSLSHVAEDDLTLPVARHQSAVTREVSRAQSASGEYFAAVKEELNTPLQVLTALASEASNSFDNSPVFAPRVIEETKIAPTPDPPNLLSAIPPFVALSASANLATSSMPASSTSGLSPALYSQLVFTRQKNKTTW
jgi:hypothetical protein